MDATGKGGNIKRIREKLDPTGYEVNGISAPTDVELKHHYYGALQKICQEAVISNYLIEVGMGVY